MRTCRWVRLTASVLPLVAAGCSDEQPAGPPAVASIALAVERAELELGDSTVVVASILDASGVPLPDQPVTWTSSDPNIVTVTDRGVAVGRAGGSAAVRASAGGRSASVALTVHPWNVADDVVVVDSTALRLISDATDRVAGTLVFEVLTQEAPTFEADVVIVGAQGGGFLRRVTGVEATPGQLTLATGPAALSDIIEFGAFETSVDLLFGPGLSPAAFSAAARTVRPGEVVWSEGTFTYLAPGLVPARAGFDLSGIDVCELLKDADAGASCPSGIKKLEVKSGRLDFEPDLELEAEFDGFDLESFRGVAKGDLSLDVALALDAEVALPSYEAKPRLFTFTKSFATAIGPVPVVGYVEMNVDGNLTVKATAKGAVEAGYEATGSIEIGAEWNDTWTPVAENSGDFEPRTPSIADGTLSASIEVEASVGLKPRLMVIFYGVVGPFAEVEPFGKATLTFGTGSCNLKTETGINAAVGFTIPFLADDVADYDHEWKPAIEGPGSDWDCPLGTLDVGVATGGDNADDSYTVAVDGTTKATISGNGRATIEFVQTGDRTVTLEGVAPNCSVDGEQSQTVAVTPGSVHTVDFVVTCSALTGSVEVTTSTSGAALDTDGYEVTLGGTSQPIGTNAQVAFENVAVGLQTVTLSDVAANCDVGGGSVVDVQVQSGATAAVHFAVQCSAAELTVRVPTDGPPAQTSGWTVLLDGAQPRAVVPNGQTTYTTTPGTHSVRLTGLPANCQVEGENPQTVDVSGGGPTEVDIAVTCESGGLTVTVGTEGDPDPATSYLVTAGGQALAVGVNGGVGFSDLPVGAVSVELRGVPEHCTVQGLNPRSTSVPGSVTFQVVCQAPAQCSEPPANAFAIWQFVSDSTPDPAYPWSSGTAEFSTLTYGEVAGAVSAASSDEDEYSKTYTADTEWKDHLFFVPIDPERMDEAVTLRYRHVGHVEVEHAGSVRAQALVWASHFGSTVLSWYETSDPVSPQRIDFDEIVEMPVTLGQWALLAGQVTLRAQAFEIASMQASASQKITLLDVRDASDQLVPIAEVCTASGTDYTEGG